MVLSHDITLTIMVEIKKDNYNKCWQVITATGTLTPLLHEAKWYDHFRKSLEFFLKGKYTFKIRSRHSAPQYLPNESKSLYKIL